MKMFGRLAVLFVLALALLAVGVVTAQDAAPGATSAATSGLLTGVRHLHSLVRWLLVLVTIVTIIKLVLGFVQNAAYDRLAQQLMRAFSGLISLQWLIGLVFIIVLISIIGFGGLQGYNWLHVVVMTVATGLAEMHRRFKDAPDRSRYRASLIIVVMVLVLEVIGVALLPYGWRLLPPSA